jgi:serine/threonine protein kinase
MAPSPPRPGRPPAGQEDPEDILCRFDEAWQRGTAPPIGDFLSGSAFASEPARRHLLEELIRIDLEYRWRRPTDATGSGRTPSPERLRLEDYVSRYPQLGPLGQLGIELIGDEYRVRQRWGDRPEPAEYRARFPAHGAKLLAVLARIDAELAVEVGQGKKAMPGPDNRSAGRSDGIIQPIGSVRALLDALRPFLAEERWNELVQSDRQGRWDDAKSLAAELLKLGSLTAYQVNQLLQGKGQDLVLGSYLLLERLGEGGAGQVFKARHRMMNRLIALKLIRKELLTDAEAVKRFYREIQVVSKLDHPNVVRAYDAGAVGAIHFLAMEYIEGSDLGRLVKQGGPLPVLQACEYIRQAALGLQYAHERGIVHRDIKPHNLIISAREGLVKVADLGLARLPRAVNDEVTAMLTGARTTGTLTPEHAIMMGTADYLAPEQAVDFHQADIRADIYSLGCSFYFLLAGQPPFPGGTLATKVARHLQSEPPSIEESRDVPRELSLVLRRLLAKKPEQRYQTPGAVAEALTPFVDASSITVPISVPMDRASSKPGALFSQVLGLTAKLPGTGRLRDLAMRRRWQLLAMGVGMVLLAVSVILVQQLFSTKARASRELHKLLGRRDSHAGDQVALWKDFAKFRSRYANTSEAEQATELLRQDLVEYRALRPGTPTSREAARLLTDLPSPFDGLKHEDLPERERELLPSEVVAILPYAVTLPRESGVASVAISSDGRLVASCSGSLLGLWEPATGVSRTEANSKLRIDCAALAPNGLTVVAGVQQTAPEPNPNKQSMPVIKSWPVATFKNPFVFQANHSPNHRLFFLLFSPDGQMLVSCVGTELRAWDAVSGKQLHAFGATGGKYKLTSGAFSPDGSILAIGRSDHFVTLFDAATRKQVRSLSLGCPVNSVAFSPDGAVLAAATEEGAIKLLDAATLEERRSLTGHEQRVETIAFRADGLLLASAGQDGTIRIWDPQTGTERKQIRLGSAAVPIRQIACSPDGRHLATANGNATVYLLRLALPLP